jgi:arylsulfatase A-like enzyme
MLTGRHPTKTLIYGNREWWGDDHPDWDSLPMQFKKDGYQTIRTGKIFHEGIDDTAAWVKGGDARRWSASPSKQIGKNAPATSAAEATAHVQTMTNYDRERAAQSDRWEAVDGEAAAKLGDTQVGDRAIAHLREAKASGEPFFLAVGFSKPHSPLVAPKQFFDLYDVAKIPLPPDFAPRPTVPEGFPRGSIRPNNADLFVRRDATPEEARAMIRAYLACVSYVDWNVGRVLGELEQLGLAENTIVVFWGDHGYQLGEKGKWSKAGSLWEQGARVPLMIYDPRGKANGQSSPRIVESVDIYPTLVELCGISKEEGIDGRSLKPLLENPQAEWNHVAHTLWNERGKGISGVVVRTERWRYAEFYGPGAGAMLTDPINDPHELKNLVNEPQYADVVRELSAKAKAYVGDQAEQGGG